MHSPKVESLAVVPNPDGTGEDVYLSVVREIGGSEVRYIEWMGLPFDATREDVVDALFLDSALTYSGSPVLTLSGLSHLEGETVAICADGAVRDPAVVVSGQITLASPASVVHVGLPYTSAIETLKPDLPLPDGTLQARQQRIVRMYLRLHESMGGQVIRDGQTEPMTYPDSTPDPVTLAVPLFSGDYEVLPPAGWDRGAPVRIETSDPLPFTILGLVFEVQSDD